MTMRQFQNRLNARLRRDTTKGTPQTSRESASAVGAQADIEPRSHKYRASYGNREYCAVCGKHKAQHGRSVESQMHAYDAAEREAGVYPDPRCPKCGFTMCELFDERQINDLATVAVPNGRYQCYRCVQSRP